MGVSLRRSVGGRRHRPGAQRRAEAAGARVGALFDEFAPMVLAVCRYQLRDAQAAEDAAQETFLSAHRSLLAGTQPRDPAAWLATIARNECRRVGRTPRPAPLAEETIAAHVDPADIVVGRSELSAVAGAIAELPARQREALVLREFCGLSYEQVAVAMSVSGAAVDSLLSRARRRLIEQLGDIPRAAHGTLVVPASLREELARLIPGLDAAGAATGAGAGGVAAFVGLGSAPAAKVAATCAATVALAVPIQGTLREDEEPNTAESRPAAATEAARERLAPARLGAAPLVTTVGSGDGPASTDDGREDGEDSSGPGSGSDSSGPGSGSDGSGSSGSGSGGSGSDSSGPGSGDSGSDSSGSGSSGSGSGSSGSGSSGPGSGDSGSDSSGSGSSGSGSSGSGSGSSDDE